jgi:hypothetical protein
MRTVSAFLSCGTARPTTTNTSPSDRDPVATQSAPGNPADLAALMARGRSGNSDQSTPTGTSVAYDLAAFQPRAWMVVALLSHRDWITLKSPLRQPDTSHSAVADHLTEPASIQRKRVLVSITRSRGTFTRA